MSIVSILENPKFTTFASGAAGAVYATTAVKAAVRPAVIYKDKHADTATKKYTASKEFIYQVLCLGVALSIVPLFRKGGFELAKKALKDIDNQNDINVIKDTFVKTVKNKAKGKNIDAKLSKIKDTNLENFEQNLFDGFYKAAKTTENISDKTKEMVTRVHGGQILGEFVGSILGLTILAPLLSMVVLHPILKAFGVENNKK